MEYLGSLGRLIGLRTSSDLGMSSLPRYSTEQTIEGRRRTQVIPASPRTWDVSWRGARAEALAGITPFATGAWGNGPWHWVPLQAQSGNLLTPREAMLLDRASVSTSNVQDAGPVRDSTGAWSPRSVTVTLDSGWVALMRGVPVLPGQPFTFSCDVQGGFTPGQVHVRFVDAAGGTVLDTSATAPNAGMRRVSVTTVVPAGAVEALVGVRSQTLVATRPQVTWTTGPVPWSPGYGCRAAVVDDLSEGLTATDGASTYSQVGFTVMEVS